RRQGSRGARRRGRRPARRASGHAAPDVAVGRRHAAGRREPEPRGGGGQGRRHHVRAGDSRDRSRAARCRAHDRLGQRPPAGARLSRAARAVVLAPRRHARDPARHHCARAGPAMNELRTILGDVVTRLFTDRVTKDLIEAAEQGQWPEPLWRAVEENGLTLPVVPESKGGAGGTWADAYIVMRAAGRHAVPLPLAETIVGAWVLSESGLDVPTGPLTLAPVHRDETLRLTRAGGGWRLSGTAARVPWGGAAGHVVGVAGGERRGMVARAACRAADRGDPAFEVAVAKVRVGEAVGIGASIAHQTHGAIGFTYEHALQFTTRRLWAWRAEFGGESDWAVELGRSVCEHGADAL